MEYVKLVTLIAGAIVTVCAIVIAAAKTREYWGRGQRRGTISSATGVITSTIALGGLIWAIHRWWST